MSSVFFFSRKNSVSTGFEGFRVALFLSGEISFLAGYEMRDTSIDQVHEAITATIPVT